MFFNILAQILVARCPALSQKGDLNVLATSQLMWKMARSEFDKKRTNGQTSSKMYHDQCQLGQMHTKAKLV